MMMISITLILGMPSTEVPSTWIPRCIHTWRGDALRGISNDCTLHEPLWHCFVISRFIPVTSYARPVSHFYLYVFDVCKVCWMRTYLRLIRPLKA
jgi:uncharacterized protein (DUF608 family)